MANAASFRAPDILPAAPCRRSECNVHLVTAPGHLFTAAARRVARAKSSTYTHRGQRDSDSQRILLTRNYACKVQITKVKTIHTWKGELRILRRRLRLRKLGRGAQLPAVPGHARHGRMCSRRPRFCSVLRGSMAAQAPHRGCAAAGHIFHACICLPVFATPFSNHTGHLGSS